jgi:serine protease Do
VVVGYPLNVRELLAGEATVTTGTLSSLVGIRGDRGTFQLTASIQLGSSGGPILDRWGAVIGVVVSKLDAIEVARATGDIPQNVNFGIQRRVLAEFLCANRVNYTTQTHERMWRSQILESERSPSLFPFSVFDSIWRLST